MQYHRYDTSRNSSVVTDRSRSQGDNKESLYMCNTTGMIPGRNSLQLFRVSKELLRVFVFLQYVGQLIAMLHVSHHVVILVLLPIGQCLSSS